MFQLIYTSTPTLNLDQDLRKDIAERARVGNAKIGITGVLLMFESAILQVLEGEEAQVRQLYHRISADRWHEDCEVLLSRDIETRTFPQWSMGYCEAEAEYEIKLAIVALKARRTARESLEDTAPIRAASQ